ncbi:hypothetical protein [Zhongshania sp.]|uniref:hypothetical protein n=1 Tax=Zhongshania sp. TaxID=1971902 RepID=UPI003567DD50
MKKEIKVTIYEERLTKDIWEYSFKSDRRYIFTNPLTITVDVPEPKVEITPSRLREAMQLGQSDSVATHYIDGVVKELFGEQE